MTYSLFHWILDSFGKLDEFTMKQLTGIQVFLPIKLGNRSAPRIAVARGHPSTSLIKVLPTTSLPIILVHRIDPTTHIAVRSVEQR